MCPRSELLKLIEKCFSLGQGGYNESEDRSYYIDYAMRYAIELGLIEEEDEDFLVDYAMFCYACGKFPSHHLRFMEYYVADDILFAVDNKNTIYLVGVVAGSSLDGIDVPVKWVKTQDCYRTSKDWYAELSKLPKVGKSKRRDYVVDTTTNPELLFEKRYVLSYADYKLAISDF